MVEALPVIPDQDSDSHREEIDIFLGPDDLIPPEIERDDYNSEDDKNSTVDELVLLHTPFPNEDECFDPRGNIDEIDAFLAIKISTYIKEGYYDSDGDVFYLERLLVNDTTHNLFPEVLFDHEPQCFKDESELDTLKNMVKVFDPGIWEKTFFPSCVRLSSKDHHYLFFTIVVQILFTHHVNFLFSFGSEDTIFDPGIFAFNFSSQEPVAVKCTDIAKITRKHSKPDKHGHGNGKSAQEPGFSSKAKKRDPMIARNEWSKSEQAGACVED
ncbi:hypothetical protein Tco_0397861 [Tanacetum coccineum]